MKRVMFLLRLIAKGQRLVKEAREAIGAGVIFAASVQMETQPGSKLHSRAMTFADEIEDVAEALDDLLGR